MWNRFLDLLYPPACAACDELLENGQRAGPFCTVCALSVETGSSGCARCGRGHQIASGCSGTLLAHAAAEFGGSVALAIRRLKFHARPDLARPLAQLWQSRTRPPPTADVAVPVPLHPRRLQTRGFNQAAVLALALGDSRRAATGRHLPVSTSSLARVRDTPPQTSLGLVERRKNLRGAFVAEPRRVRGRRVLLVDDVLTTGATAEACAAALYAAGAADVVALTLARAVP